MAEPLSRSTRLAMAVATTSYVGVCLVVGWWAFGVAGDLMPPAAGTVVGFFASALAAMAFPFWRSVLDPAQRHDLVLGTAMAGFAGAFVVVLGSLAFLDPNVGSPWQGSQLYWTMAVAAVASALAGAYVLAKDLLQPPAPGSARAKREAKLREQVAQKGIWRIVAGFMGGALGAMMVVMFLRAISGGRWDVAHDITFAVLLSGWMAYNLLLRARSAMSRPPAADSPPAASP
jgi:hypothetical protein